MVGGAAGGSEPRAERLESVEARVNDERRHATFADARRRQEQRATDSGRTRSMRISTQPHSSHERAIRVENYQGRDSSGRSNGLGPCHSDAWRQQATAERRRGLDACLRGRSCATGTKAHAYGATLLDDGKDRRPLGELIPSPTSKVLGKHRNVGHHDDVVDMGKVVGEDECRSGIDTASCQSEVSISVPWIGPEVITGGSSRARRFNSVARSFGKTACTAHAQLAELRMSDNFGPYSGWARASR
jgi:hypothetical protein